MCEFNPWHHQKKCPLQCELSWFCPFERKDLFLCLDKGLMIGWLVSLEYANVLSGYRRLSHLPAQLLWFSQGAWHLIKPWLRGKKVGKSFPCCKTGTISTPHPHGLYLRKRLHRKSHELNLLPSNKLCEMCLNTQINGSMKFIHYETQGTEFHLEDPGVNPGTTLSPEHY